MLFNCLEYVIPATTILSSYKENSNGKTHPILLKTVDICLEMFELGHTRKSRCFDVCSEVRSDSKGFAFVVDEFS